MSKLNKTRLVLAFVVTGIVVFVSLILFPNWQGTGFWGILALAAIAFVSVTTWFANFPKAYFDDNSARVHAEPNKSELITLVRRTDTAVLIKREIRYPEQDALASATEAHQLPLQQEKADFPSQLDLAYQERIREANSVSLNVLVWGPSESDPDLYRKRLQIRNTLRLIGHDARFSEESQVSPQELGALTLRQLELIQAQLADWIIILYSSYGSIAETHDIWNFNDLRMKLLVLVDQQHTGSYGAQGLLKSLHRHQVYAYATEELKTCSLVGKIIEEANYRRNEKWEERQRARSG